MSEKFFDKLLRNMVRYPAGLRGLSAFVSAFRGPVSLPLYVPPEVGFPTVQDTLPGGKGPIFITARYRSGSTLLWQIFQRLEGFTAFYEPLNERQWFNPEHRGSRVDESHRGTSDYAANYENLEFLNDIYRREWILRRLAMGEKTRDDNLVKYIQALIDAAPDWPVLQFNRIDFRLEFLNRWFPEATLVHVRRSARDTWRSTLQGMQNDQAWTLETFAPHSKFYLLQWYCDLALAFPWLICSYDKTHPYEVHYMISRLSELFACRHAHVFMSYERLVLDFEGEIQTLLDTIGAHAVDTTVLKRLNAPRTEPYCHERDHQFYSEIETVVENKLQHALGRV